MENQDDEQNPSNNNNLSWPGYMTPSYGPFMVPYNPSMMFPQYTREKQTPLFAHVYQSQPSFSQLLHSEPSQSQPSESQPSQFQPSFEATNNNSSLARAGNWSELEDKRLCYAWVRISTDPITGSNQKNRSFWGRVFDDFKEQHGENELMRRNKKACELRMQHIKADLKKWSATLKRVYDCPRSGLNQQGMEQAAHSLYRGQVNKKRFILEHCWDILSKCPIFMRTIASTSHIDSTPYVTPPNISSHSSRDIEGNNPPLSVDVQEGNMDGDDVEGGDELRDTPLVERTVASIRSNNDLILDDVGEEHQSPPPVRARPAGRKATKRAKRQISIDAQSSLGERVAKSLEDMHHSNSVGWHKTTELQEQEQQANMKKIRMQSLFGRMALEKEAMILEKFMLKADPSALGSPSEKARVFHERRMKIADLQTQANALLEIDTPSRPSTSSGHVRNLQSRFDEEAND